MGGLFEHLMTVVICQVAAIDQAMLHFDHAQACLMQDQGPQRSESQITGAMNKSDAIGEVLDQVCAGQVFEHRFALDKVRKVTLQGRHCHWTG